jgi:restriction system-associated AAA family ATPase
MKLLRLKIVDPKGFRSLHAGFEHRFRSEWELQEEQGFSPFVCAGPNGSGKSNLLEVLAAIFYHLECIYLKNLPDSFQYDEEANPNGFRAEKATPDAFELEYELPILESSELGTMGMGGNAHIKVTKGLGKGPKWFLVGGNGDEPLEMTQTLGRQLLPEYILGYSSGENQILSLPFFKMRFVQFDEYWQALKMQLPYPGRPESRLAYLDGEFSQAIFFCNLLFQDADALKPFREDVKIEELKEFRIIIRRSFEVDESQIHNFGSQNQSKLDSIEDIVKSHPALSSVDDESRSARYRVNLVQLLESRDGILARLKRCATCWYLDDASDTLYLDYRVDGATKQAFSENFDFETNGSPIDLFQAFQVLLSLNLFSVSESLKADLYQSDSHYVNETIPTLASDERIMRFKFVKFRKTDVAEPVMLKSLSDGEHQLLHILGLCLLFKNTRSLFLFDEPETHFNPDWRSNFITRLQQSLGSSENQEMLVSTHSPFIISDSRPEKVLVFEKKNGSVSIRHPEYNTLGASINKITMTTFGKRETIGGQAQSMLNSMQKRFEQGEDKNKLIDEINRHFGDSVEKMILVKAILDNKKGQN